MKPPGLKDLKCPICVKQMKIRIVTKDHVNKASNKVSKHKHYQYYCEACDNEDTGWTSTESDTLSLKL